MNMDNSKHGNSTEWTTELPLTALRNYYTELSHEDKGVFSVSPFHRTETIIQDRGLSGFLGNIIGFAVLSSTQKQKVGEGTAVTAVSQVITGPNLSLDHV